MQKNPSSLLPWLCESLLLSDRGLGISAGVNAEPRSWGARDGVSWDAGPRARRRCLLGRRPCCRSISGCRRLRDGILRGRRRRALASWDRRGCSRWRGRRLPLLLLLRCRACLGGIRCRIGDLGWCEEICSRIYIGWIFVSLRIGNIGREGELTKSKYNTS